MEILSNIAKTLTQQWRQWRQWLALALIRTRSVIGALLLGGFLSMSLWGCASTSQTVRLVELPDPPDRLQGNETRRLSGGISEVAPPAVILDLAALTAQTRPEITIASPKPNRVIKETQIEVKLKLKGFSIYKDETLALGPHLQLILDNQPARSIYNLDDTVIFDELTPGSHTLQVVAVSPWGESFKNDGAYAQTTFHVLANTGEHTPDPDQPLLTYIAPQGSYSAEPVLLDFYLNNTPLHAIAQSNSTDDIADWRIRCSVNGQTFVFDQWQPTYLKGLVPGQNWIQLTLIDEQGQPIENAFNNTVRTFTYDPKKKDTLAKIVRGELPIEKVGQIAVPDYEPPTEPVETEPIETEPASSEPAKTEKTTAPEAVPEAVVEPTKSDGSDEPVINVPVEDQDDSFLAPEQLAPEQLAPEQLAPEERSLHPEKEDKDDTENSQAKDSEPNVDPDSRFEDISPTEVDSSLEQTESETQKSNPNTVTSPIQPGPPEPNVIEPSESSELDTPTVPDELNSPQRAAKQTKFKRFEQLFRPMDGDSAESEKTPKPLTRADLETPDLETPDLETEIIQKPQPEDLPVEELSEDESLEASPIEIEPPEITVDTVENAAEDSAEKLDTEKSNSAPPTDQPTNQQTSFFSQLKTRAKAFFQPPSPTLQNEPSALDEATPDAPPSAPEPSDLEPNNLEPNNLKPTESAPVPSDVLPSDPVILNPLPSEVEIDTSQPGREATKLEGEELSELEAETDLPQSPEQY